jgi:hypothetical protein
MAKTATTLINAARRRDFLGFLPFMGDTFLRLLNGYRRSKSCTEKPVNPLR